MKNKVNTYGKGLAFLVIASLFISGCGYFGKKINYGQKEGPIYTITIKNTLAGERLAPLLVVGDADDAKIWVGEYVSQEARTQFTTGNPKSLASVFTGDISSPGKVGVDGELKFEFRTTASSIRITAMVHPDKTPDNYVTALVNLDELPSETTLKRYDIGDDEDRKTVVFVEDAGVVSVTQNN